MSNVEIIDNMPFEDYLKLDRLSASSLKNFSKTPAYYMQQKQVKREPSDAMKLGTMIHTWMLENPIFHNYYYSMPNLDSQKPERHPDADGRAKKDSYEKNLYMEYKSDLEEYESLVQSYIDSANGREIYPEEVIQRYTALPVRNDTKNEITILWEWHGVQCKSRFDMIHFDGEQAIGIEDLKTISDIFKIDRDFLKFGYHLQAGFYAQAFFFAFGKWPKFFNFTFVSTAKDYMDMVTNPLSIEYLEIGRMRCEELVKEFKVCETTGRWPGISSFEIEAPSWL